MSAPVLLSPDAFREAVPGLAALLAEVVAGGASLGFLSPFTASEAAAWWREREPAVAGGSLLVWAVPGTSPGAVAGTVSLAPEAKPNGRHRAEVIKLMVGPQARGRGLGRALLAAAEAEAARRGAALLLLDTETGSPAERLYRAAGWTPYGLVPAYAADPSGELRDCGFYYKFLATSGRC
ncbi:GNAT family N-acetyltransferase [Streptomyces sp. DSM 44917]|uniref:GNAT family N-acetyltransferase n=1 Tax=Streptomyces boetiae TaxID=3075541 RepID=A0ABU2LG86_9ACTN|nr:GNAT family N-acetyltransferase [Streptomyces sp. DSM 44917]MDT0310591.1 GNAT family N-acetyltransferase [Streptomyces sp. DSM 44917]